MLAGWFALAMLVIALAGPDRDGGIAMGAFFNIGPIGGVFGFIGGVLLFVRFGMRRRRDEAVADAAPPEARQRVSPVFAVVVVAVAAGLAWWGWYEFIRSPYLSHGFMTLALQFKLPPGMALPPEASDVRIVVTEGEQPLDVALGPRWRGTDGDRKVILASVTLSRKTGRRAVTLALPGVTEQSWRIDLPNDPDPTPGYSEWRLAGGNATPKIEMNFALSADR
jgi:hypothetical protein